MNWLLTKTFVVPLAVILIGFAGVFWLSEYIETNKPPMPAGYEDEDLVFHGGKLRDFTLGLNGLIADWYWMQSLQYLGGKFAQKPDVRINVNDLREFEPKLLHPLLDNAVSFDPQFIGVFEYGAIVLPSIDPASAVRIVEKGIENNPKEWRLYNHLGYIYWKNGDYEKASNAYSKAADIEGAPSLMRSMVAKMKSDGGSRETARSIYSQMFESANDSSTKQTAFLFLLKLDALDEIDAMNNILRSLPQSDAACVSDLRSILPQLIKVQLPNDRKFRIDAEKNMIDPGGAAYVLNRSKCLVELDSNLTKLPLD